MQLCEIAYTPNPNLWQGLIVKSELLIKLSCNNCAEVEGMPAWTARLSSNILPQYAVAIASSNRWPGAHTYAVGRLVGL